MDVIVDLPNGQSTTARLSSRFWTTCPEFRSADIGRFLLEMRLAPWPKGKPPSLELVPLEGNRFRLGL
jgi:hypothetical protein